MTKPGHWTLCSCGHIAQAHNKGSAPDYGCDDCPCPHYDGKRIPFREWRSESAEPDSSLDRQAIRAERDARLRAKFADVSDTGLAENAALIIQARINGSFSRTSLTDLMEIYNEAQYRYKRRKGDQ